MDKDLSYSFSTYPELRSAIQFLYLTEVRDGVGTKIPVSVTGYFNI